MMRRFTLPRPGAELERWLFALLIGGGLWAAVIVGIMPLPANMFFRVLLLAGLAVGGSIVVSLVATHVVHRSMSEMADRVATAEQQLRDAERLASVGRVAAGIAHEVGNPLTGISNFAHILRARAAASPEAEVAIAGIEREVERVDRIVNSLLDYARPKAAEPAPFDAGSTLKAAVQLLAAQGVFRRVEIHSSIQDQPISLVGHPHELEQAFVNLLLNAIDAMAAEGTLALYAGRLTPETMLRSPRRSYDEPVQAFERRANPRLDAWRAEHPADEPCAKFVIADSGAGVPRGDSDRIFDPFFTTKPAGDGSGLGLAIVQRIVEEHQGVVWAQKAREGGAAFHIVLPLGAFEKAPTQVS